MQALRLTGPMPRLVVPICFPASSASRRPSISYTGMTGSPARRQEDCRISWACMHAQGSCLGGALLSSFMHALQSCQGISGGCISCILAQDRGFIRLRPSPGARCTRPTRGMRCLGSTPHLVQVEEQVRALADHQAPLRGHALPRERGELLEQARQVDDDAVADHALRAGVQDAARHQVQRVLRAGRVVDGVPRVRATLRQNRPRPPSACILGPHAPEFH